MIEVRTKRGLVFIKHVQIKYSISIYICLSPLFFLFHYSSLVKTTHGVLYQKLYFFFNLFNAKLKRDNFLRIPYGHHI